MDHLTQERLEESSEEEEEEGDEWGWADDKPVDNTVGARSTHACR